MKKLLLAFLLLALPALGQVVGGGGRAFVFVGAASGLPAACNVGQIAFATDATAGQNIYECASANTWTQQLGATPGGTTGQIQYNNSGVLAGKFVLPAANGTTGDFLTSSGSTTSAWTWTTPTTVGGSPAVGDIYYVSGTNTALTLADVAAGSMLCSGGVTTAPSYCNTLSSLVMTGALTPQTTGGIVGTTAANSANAGSVGEVATCTIATGSSVTLGTGTTSNVCSINTLSAGDWDCNGAVDFTFGATTSYTNLVGSISTTTATLGAQDSKFDYETAANVPTASADATWVLPTVRVNISSATQVFLVAQATFSISSLKAYGTLRCRRMR